MFSPIKKPCAHGGCQALVAGGRCEAHAVSRIAEGRESASRRGYGRQHQKWRLAILARDPICKACGRAASNEADHKIPIAAGGARFAMENGQGLCHPCHSSKTATENGFGLNP